MGLSERQGGFLLLAFNQPVPGFRPWLLFQSIMDLPGGFVAMCLVQPLMVVEVDVQADSGLGLFYAVVCFEINLLVFEASPQALHEDIVKVWINLAPLARPTGVGLLVNGLNAHQPHQALHPFAVYGPVKQPGKQLSYLAGAIKRCLQVLMVDQLHQHQWGPPHFLQRS